MVKSQTSLWANACCQLLSVNVEAHLFTNGNELSNAACLPPDQNFLHTGSDMEEGLVIPHLCFALVEAHMPIQNSVKWYSDDKVLLYSKIAEANGDFERSKLGKNRLWLHWRSQILETEQNRAGIAETPVSPLSLAAVPPPCRQVIRTAAKLSQYIIETWPWFYLATNLIPLYLPCTFSLLGLLPGFVYLKHADSYSVRKKEYISSSNFSTSFLHWAAIATQVSSVFHVLSGFLHAPQAREAHWILVLIWEAGAALPPPVCVGKAQCKAPGRRLGLAGL